MPDTTSYLILGLVAFTVIFGGFVLSLLVRFNNARKDITTLETLAKD